MSAPIPCEKCGSPAIVHITHDWGQYDAVRHLCLACADQEDAAERRSNPILNRAAVYLTIGLMILLLSAVADELKFGLREGFGYRQIIGVTVSGSIILIGALTRTATLAVVGVFAEAVTLLADWLRIGEEPGFGALQITGCVLGGLLIIKGLVLGRTVLHGRT